MSNSFYGLPTQSIENGLLRVDFLTTAGPRIVRLVLVGSRINLLAETPNAKWETPYGEFHLYGGHRLWYAPEVFPETSFPDDKPVHIEKMPNGVRLQAPPESISGIIKSLELSLASNAPALTVIHRLQNEGAQTRELAPWGITELPLGGVAFLPEHTTAPELGPKHRLAVWSYTHWSDPRLELRDDCIQVYADRPSSSKYPSPLKIGYLDTCGSVGYLKGHLLLVKRFRTLSEGVYPDFNCNVEVYVNDRYLELETLAPLTRLEPGQAVTYQETWQVYKDVRDRSEAQALLN